ncbi:MAG: phosphoheptose isomerase [Chloroflexi bacterium RBG_16_50_11]|nr:MAG: phosphoheptose isomerase [Chloroflexi bacterium RBG_16_50_11]
MEELVKKHIEDSIDVKKQLSKTNSKTIAQIAEVMVRAYRKGNKVVWFGNGGSAADAQHLSCELVGKFYLKRKALESLALTTNTSILTAIANDYDFGEVFARQVEAMVKPGDIAIGISTSGNSQNVIRGIEEAKKLGATTVALTGAKGGALKGKVDYLLAVPSTEGPRIQESHIMVGHILCYLVEKEIFGEGNTP